MYVQPSTPPVTFLTSFFILSNFLFIIRKNGHHVDLHFSKFHLFLHVNMYFWPKTLAYFVGP